MMRQWQWIDKRLLVILHDESLVLHGGAAGIRDEGLLDSALNRAVNLALYGKPDFAELAAAYGVGLAKNHAFVDGALLIKNRFQISIPLKHQEFNGIEQHFHRLRVTFGLAS